jgi:hypothetical protein
MQKTLRFDALIEKRVDTYVQARKSQHPNKQLDQLDLSSCGDQGTYADPTSGRPSLSLRSDRVEETRRAS